MPFWGELPDGVMSPAVETAFPEQAKALYAGFQEHYQHPATDEDVCSYPSVGSGCPNVRSVSSTATAFAVSIELWRQEGRIEVSSTFARRGPFAIAEYSLGSQHTQT